MNKRIGGVLAGVIVALSLACPAHASSSVPQAEAVVRASNALSIAHAPRSKYVVTSLGNAVTFVQPLRRALRHCHSDRVCQASTWGYYRELHNQWRVLNRNLWKLVGDLPLCSPTILNDCAYPAGPQHGPTMVIVTGRHYTANQGKRFSR